VFYTAGVPTHDKLEISLFIYVGVSKLCFDKYQTRSLPLLKEYAMQEKTWENLQDFIQTQMEKHYVPGVSVSIYHEGDLKSAGFGITSVENPLLVTDQTLFQVGSITKTFVGLAIMRLIEKGEINLDAPVRTYYPEFKVADETASAAITIRHLLTHTAGYNDHVTVDGGSGDDAVARFVGGMHDLQQISPVGAYFSYNSSAFCLLGHIISLVTGKTLEKAIAELVIEPLDLQNCLFKPGEVMVNRFAVGHYDDEGEIKVARSWALPRAVWAAGGLVCSVDELLKYGVFYLRQGTAENGAQILESETIQKVLQPQTYIWPDVAAMGLSWFVKYEDGIKIVSHFGGTAGQRAHICLLPGEQFALAVLTNAVSGLDLIKLTRKWCLETFYGLDESTHPVEMPLAVKEEVAGRYIIPGRFYTNIKIQDDTLIAQDGFFSDTEPDDLPPPYTLDFIDKDRLMIVDGWAKNMKCELIRDASGSIHWIRIRGFVLIKES
jgi:CubicO group peptidase (beta-lactamase class C family)